MVLQQGPAVAAVYGTLPNASTGGVAVQVSGGASYSVAAIITKVPGAPSRWKAMLKPAAAGGSYTITATAQFNSTFSMTASITDATFGDVWYCGGQSNMALPVHFTTTRNISMDAIKAGKYNNIRLHGIAGNMNPFMNWTTALYAASTFARASHGHASTMKILETFSSTCWYFGESLVDEMGEDAVPIGLVHTAYGGSKIEQWLDNATIAECANASIGVSNAEFHATRVLPYTDMTLKGWVWYQGENDMHNYFGNSILKTGYSCLMTKLVSTWRTLWSTTAGTTVPDAAFGVVTLAASGGEGGADISAMRVAQAGGYGVLPNVAMPNTFLAHAYDLSDPYGNISCYKDRCCDNNWNPNNTLAQCHGCSSHFGGATVSGIQPYCEMGDATPFYMGPIHPRVKKPVGVRLAKAAMAVAYKKGAATVGPTLSGCTKLGTKITLTFNKTLLGSGGLTVRPQSEWGYADRRASMMDVLVNKSAWCIQIKEMGKRQPPECWDDGYGHTGPAGPYYDIEQPAASLPCIKPGHCPPPPPPFAGFAWMPVDIAAGSDPNTVEVDLAVSGGVAFAIRYAWVGGGDCCQGRNHTSAPCIPASCPLMGAGELAPMPASPFVAKITAAGKCQCVPPVVCDE